MIKTNHFVVRRTTYTIDPIDFMAAMVNSCPRDQVIKALKSYLTRPDIGCNAINPEAKCELEVNDQKTVFKLHATIEEEREGDW